MIRGGTLRVVLLVACAGCAGTGPARPASVFLDGRDPSAVPVVLVDLDDTVYERATGRPMSGAAEALRELSRDHVIVYVTARPTYAKVPFVTQNRHDSIDFLWENGFPDGPLFTSSLWWLVRHGQGGGKARSLERLHELGFGRIALAVGDRPHDLDAYLGDPVPPEHVVIVLVEDEEHPDRDRAGLPGELLEHAIAGSGAAWPRILAAYRAGDLADAVGWAVSQPPPAN